MEKRLFIAIPLSQETAEKLEEYTTRVRIQNIRWIPKQNIHITLYFIGDLKEEQIPGLVEEFEQLYSNTQSFVLTFDKITFAPPNRQARMIWAQFHKNQNYEELLKKTDDVVKTFLQNAKTYNAKELIPHATLARFRIPLDPNKIVLKQPEISDLKVSSCVLMESELNANGAIYTTVAKFIFNTNQRR